MKSIAIITYDKYQNLIFYIYTSFRLVVQYIVANFS